MLLVELYWKGVAIRRSTKYLCNLFLVIGRTRRIGLAGFSDLQCVVYVSVYVAFLDKFLHNCTVFAQVHCI